LEKELFAKESKAMSERIIKERSLGFAAIKELESRAESKAEQMLDAVWLQYKAL